VRLGGYTLYDAGGIIADARNVNNGISVTLEGEGASKSLPNTGATWSKPGIYGINKKLISGYLAQEARLGIRVVERLQPAFPNLIKFGFGFGNHADPNQATHGVIWGIANTGTTVRAVFCDRAGPAATWTESIGAGQAACAGVDGSYVPASPTGIDEITGLPLADTGLLGTIGTNTIRVTATYSSNPVWTHTYIFVGWHADNGVNGSTVVFNAKYWANTFEGRD
jgi:hypothetical protein